VLLVAGCETTKNHPSSERELDAAGAALLASKLANQECRRVFGTQPFKPGTFAAEFKDGKWRWGFMDPGGPNGYSAVVRFDRHGTVNLSEDVQVYFSSDSNNPPPPKRREDHFGPFTPENDRLERWPDPTETPPEMID
jgi:hypothetical protein